jgi:hypothetical protein
VSDPTTGTPELGLREVGGRTNSCTTQCKTAADILQAWMSAGGRRHWSQVGVPLASRSRSVGLP